MDDDTTVREERVQQTAEPPSLRLARVSLETALDADIRQLTCEVPVLVGRKPGDGGFSIRDVKLSRAHFRVAWNGRSRAFVLEDQRSQNGTYVDGRPVTSATLRVGTVIRAGDSLFVCFSTSAARHPSIEHVARSGLNVLITGETGSGKERLAVRLHEESGRRPLVSVNCGAIPRELIASELFGHVRGAYSGAMTSRPGLFARANEGTLFLDEIVELPLDQQPALLRVLEDGKVRPVGGDGEVTVNVRVLAATNASPLDAIERGRMRADLYARLAGHVIELPPLRRQRETILSIAGQILRDLSVPWSLGTDVLEALLLWDFPYNVRELKTCLRSLHAFVPGAERIGLDELRGVRPALVDRLMERRALRDDTEVSDSMPPPRAELTELLDRFGGNVTALAKHLGRSRSSVYRWMRRVGLEPAEGD